MQSLIRRMIPPHAAARREQRRICLKRHEPVYLVIRGLTQSHHSSQRHHLILVARGLSAPRRSVDIGRSVDHPDHRIIIIQKVRTLYMLEPQTGVCTLSRAALAKEHISLAILPGHGSMHHKSVVRSGAKSIQEHHGIAQRELKKQFRILLRHIHHRILVILRSHQDAVRMFLSVGKAEEP